MPEGVLDAWAVLAFLNKERGEQFVSPWLRGGLISAVNAGEVLNRQYRPGKSLEDIVLIFRSLELQVVVFDFEQSIMAASLEPYARAAGLSFADRDCLSLGMMRGHPVLTGDDNRTKPALAIDIRLIRDRKSNPATTNGRFRSPSRCADSDRRPADAPLVRPASMQGHTQHRRTHLTLRIPNRRIACRSSVRQEGVLCSESSIFNEDLFGQSISRTASHPSVLAMPCSLWCTGSPYFSIGRNSEHQTAIALTMSRV